MDFYGIVNKSVDIVDNYLLPSVEKLVDMWITLVSDMWISVNNCR